MATVKSGFITNLEGNTINDRGSKGVKHSMIAKYASTGAIAINTVIAMLPISIDATILSVKLSSDDHGTTGDMHIGFHKIDGTTAIDIDAIAADVDVNDAALVKAEQRFAVKAIETLGQKVWALAGLSARPSYDECYVTLTASEATTAAGDLVLEIDYLV